MSRTNFFESTGRLHGAKDILAELLKFDGSVEQWRREGDDIHFKSKRANMRDFKTMIKYLHDNTYELERVLREGLEYAEFHLDDKGEITGVKFREV